ncbi:MAG: spermidine synthase [Bdellovibrio sp.]|nr:MAG: spermidine synthase [Bdellovibrio sp.]
MTLFLFFSYNDSMLYKAQQRLKNFTFFLVFLSGFTGLVYEVVWQKYLSLYLGSHALSAALVLSTFFLFLSLGYFLLGQQKWIRNWLWFYGLLELVIGLYTFVSPQYFEGLKSFFSALPDHLLIHFLFASLFIGPPTFLMGGTIPALTQALSQHFSLSHRTHALIYGWNTLGAFLGTLLAGFYFIEAWGLALTLFYTALINIFIAFTVYLLAYKTSLSKLVTRPHHPPSSFRIYWPLLCLSFFSGFYVFSLENLWIRMAGISLGSSTYTFTIIVGAFIFAIGIGSLWVSYQKISRLRFLFLVQLFLFIASVVTFLMIPHWPFFFQRIRALFASSLLNFSPYWSLVFLSLLVLLFIPVGLMGANLPLLFNYLRYQRKSLSHTVGQLYAVNSLGSALGALIGGYVVFLWLDGSEVFQLNLVLMAISLSFIGLLYENKLLFSASVLLSVLLIGITFQLPAWKPSAFAPSAIFYSQPPPQIHSAAELKKPLQKYHQNHKIIFHRFDPNTTVEVTQDLTGNLTLFVNGKPDAGTNSDQVTRAMAVLFPLSISPKPLKKVFIAGLGAGLSLGISTLFEDVKQVKVAEISQGVIEALPLFNSFNYDLQKRKHKYQILLGDAYKVLQKQKDIYDLIVCEPSNPWVSGVEKLFSLEYYQQALSRLSPHGFYAQWFPLFDMNPETFLTILKTFQKAFPWTTVWFAGGDSALTLIGSRRPPQINISRLKSLFQKHTSLYKAFHLNTPYSILGHQALPPFTVIGLTRQAPQLHTLTRPLLEFQAGRSHFAKLSTNLNNLVSTILQVPIPSSFQSTRFLMDQLPSPLPLSFYQDALRRLSPRSFFHKARLRWHLTQDHPSSPLAFQNTSWIPFLLDTSTPPPQKLNPSSQNFWSTFEKVRKLYILLKLSYQQPQWKKLAQLLPSPCQTLSCTQAKINALYLIAPPKKKASLKNLWALSTAQWEKYKKLVDQKLNHALAKKTPLTF